MVSLCFYNERFSAFCLLVRVFFVLFLFGFFGLFCKCNLSGKSLGPIFEKHMVAGACGQL